ncbi:MAG: hypothetical protein V4773_00795 [Verrucomicrobiota bacterium]
MLQPLFALLSFSHATFTQEVILVIGVVITLLGTKFCWSAPRYRMSMEEHAKDGKITEEEARRKIDRQNWFGPLVILIGLALIGYALLK